MPPVADLEGIRQRLTHRVGVAGGAVTADDLDARMLTQPRGKGAGPAIGKDIDPPASLGVDQDRRIGPTASQREVIHSPDPRGRHLRQRDPQPGPQGRMTGDPHSQRGQHAGTGPARELSRHAAPTWAARRAVRLWYRSSTPDPCSRNVCRGHRQSLQASRRTRTFTTTGRR
ncbi:hypothetical protein Airi02_075650 [Actinoallomurus iriomotensis]|uniref:Uncharacterized protein n=1 Tax=Actinoallomurus iriomotensis TaxID=478107 RepID=A0A9W6S6T8_9ACTN|nr:hypothetical protein Airi02_075650 [Actinoallomurus iriomotensis]